MFITCIRRLIQSQEYRPGREKQVNIRCTLGWQRFVGAGFRGYDFWAGIR